MGILAEVCVTDPSGARLAAALGAGRVELCTALETGGLTPSAGLVARCLEGLSIPLRALIRPRPGDFFYGPEEQEVILEDIRRLSDLGVSGFVVGGLTPEGSPDRAFLERIRAAAGPLGLTFHRAFDVLRDPLSALDGLVEAGFDRVLTSGQQATAPEGAALLADLVARAGDRLTILAGGGIRPSNLARLIAETGVREVHFSARGRRRSPMQHRNPAVRFAGEPPHELDPSETDREVLAELLAILDGETGLS